MSKSLGNLVSPDQLIGTLGKAESSKKTPSSLLDKKWAVDVLRLWVAASDYTYDVSLGLQQLLKVGPIFGMNKKVQESYQKLRNTNRYLLSNLYDFDKTRDCVAYNALSVLDKWCLSRLYAVSNEVIQSYESFEFTDMYVSVASRT